MGGSAAENFLLEEDDLLYSLMQQKGCFYVLPFQMQGYANCIARFQVISTFAVLQNHINN